MGCDDNEGVGVGVGVFAGPPTMLCARGRRDRMVSL